MSTTHFLVHLQGIMVPNKKLRNQHPTNEKIDITEEVRGLQTMYGEHHEHVVVHKGKALLGIHEEIKNEAKRR